MKQVTKLGVHRYLNQWNFFIPVFIGAVLTIWHIFSDVIYKLQFQGNMYHGQMLYPNNVYQLCILGDITSVHNLIFGMMIPLLAVLPFAGTYFFDRKDGYIKNLLVRTSRKNYYRFNYLMTFFSGCIAVAIPMILDFLATMSIAPLLSDTRYTYHSPIYSFSMFGHVYYDNPFLYTLIFWGITMIFGGVYATISLGISNFSENYFVVMLSPMLLQEAYVYSIKLFADRSWDMTEYFCLGQGTDGMELYKIFMVLCLFVLISMALYIIPLWHNKDIL